MEDKSLLVTDLNIDITFKVAWVSFIRIGKLTYTIVEAKKVIFVKTNLIRSDIFFAKSDQYIILCLKRSKTDAEYIEILIILAATGE